MTDEAELPTVTAPRAPADGDGDPTAVTQSELAGGRRRASTLVPGTRVGRYVIHAKLAQGGMGVVYRAHDPELGRDVALKLVRVRAGADSLAIARERLLREAQALAQIAHPNVIAVHDVGAHDRDVFIAMELVEGTSLRAWSAARSRPWRELLTTLIAAARGLAAAHAAGVVHRDVKPDNVIVGADGRVRVLDFGLARGAGDGSDLGVTPDGDLDPAAFDGDTLGDGDGGLAPPGGDPITRERLLAPLTEAGAVIGTPKYMSPEHHRGGPVDARSDQYSFCLMAWELLYRAPPFTGRDRAALRLAKERGQPERPPPGAPGPARLRRLLTRGLAPAPADRFPSMAALIAALVRLEGAARRQGLAAAGVVAAAGVAALVAWRPAPTPGARCAVDDARLRGVWDGPRAAEVARAFTATHRPHAAGTATRVAAALDAYTRDWQAMRAASCEATARGEQSAQLLDLRTACLERRLAEVRALTELFVRDPDGEVVDHAVAAVGELPPLATCADAAALRDATPLPPGAAERARLAALRDRLATATSAHALGRYAAALPIAQGVVAEARDLRYPPLLAEALFLTGTLQDDVGKSADAVGTLGEAARVAATAHADDLVARALIELLWTVGQSQARPEQALAMVAATEAAVARAGDPPIRRAQLLTRRGYLLDVTGDNAGAVAALRESVRLWETTPRASPVGLASTLVNLGEVLRGHGDTEAARAEFARALALQEQALGPDHPDVGATRNNLGAALWAEGRFDEARADIERSLAIDEATYGPVHPRVAISLLNLGGLLNAQDQPAAARPYLERALAIQRQVLAPDHPDLGKALHNLGVTVAAQGDHPAALAYFEDARDVFARALGDDHVNLALPLTGIADELVALGRRREALAFYQRAIAIQDRAYGDRSLDTAYSLTSYGGCLVDLGRARDAVAPLTRAVALRSARQVDPQELADAQFQLARALWDSGRDRARARSLAASAAAAYASSGDDSPDRKAIAAWRAAHGG
ncbi:MAG: serine/threonine protein kinase [Myxococcales bacterium]|nr:serine/threonine protein kinase [Myxococcales bacterium]